MRPVRTFINVIYTSHTNISTCTGIIREICVECRFPECNLKARGSFPELYFKSSLVE